MAKRLIEALGGDVGVVEAYGKASVVGEDGELNMQLFGMRRGYSMREQMPNSKAIVPSAKKVGGPGVRIDVPVTHRMHPMCARILTP